MGLGLVGVCFECVNASFGFDGFLEGKLGRLLMIGLRSIDHPYCISQTSTGFDP
jgi:hypothetical protein